MPSYTLTEKERSQHPYAKQIPDYVFKHCLNYKFNNSLIPLFEADSFDEAKKFINIDSPLEIRLDALICLAVLFPQNELAWNELATSFLVHNDAHLHQVDRAWYESLFICIACDGEHQLMAEWLINLIPSPEFKKQMLQANDCDAFTWACANGRKALVEWLISLAPSHEFILEMIQSLDFEAFTSTCANGHKELAELLLNLAPSNEFKIKMIQAKNFLGFTWACTLIDRTLAEWLINIVPELRNQIIETRVFPAFQWACENGIQEFAEWLLNIAPEFKNEMIRANDFKALQMARKNNHLTLAKWLVMQSPTDLDYASGYEQLPDEHGLTLKKDSTRAAVAFFQPTEQYNDTKMIPATSLESGTLAKIE